VCHLPLAKTQVVAMASINTILGGAPKLWTSFLTNKRVNKYLFLENITILSLASYFMIVASLAGSVLHTGPSKFKIILFLRHSC
jgi:hypothetical protein